jgi:ATP-binding cassette, subfamily B, bacterial HlyB/CyaB
VDQSDGDHLDIGAEASGATIEVSRPGFRGDDALHPRLRAVIMAGRYYGMELDPDEFRNVENAEVPTAASLSAWIREAGMWSRAVRLKWRHLQRLYDAGPVVLLFTDGSAGLLTGANAEHKVVFIRDPMAPEGEAAVPVDELRLSEVWSGEAVLLRANRGLQEADAPFSLRWLIGLVMTERKSLRDIGVASLTMSFLAIFPPLAVMMVMSHVLEHHSWSTLTLLSVLMGIFVVYETVLGFARRLIILQVGVRVDTRLNLHVFNRLIRLSIDYFERHPAGETMHHVSAAAFSVLDRQHAGLDRAGISLCHNFDYPRVFAVAAGFAGAGDSGGDQPPCSVGRDGLRHPDGEVAGAGASAEGAVG